MRRWTIPVGLFLVGLVLFAPTAAYVWRIYASGDQLSVPGVVFSAARIVLGIGAMVSAGLKLIRPDVSAPTPPPADGDGVRLRSLIERVLANFPDAPTISGDDAAGYEALWTRDGLSAGVRTYGKQVAIFLGDAETPVSTVSQTTEILRGIFEDRYVAVGGFKNNARVKSYLAPADEIGAGLNSTTHAYQGPLPLPIDELRVRSWSGALDGGEA